MSDDARSPDDGSTGMVSGETARPQVAAGRLLGTLATAGALAGLAIVLVYQWAQPQIRAHRAEALRAAIVEVLNGPARYETLYIVDGGLTPVPPAGIDSMDADRVFRGYDDAGREVGYAVTGAQPGFQDIIELIFGYDPDTGRVLGMLVLESKETPGLGDKIIKDQHFVGEFRDALAPLTGIKPADATDDPHEVDMITGATISSRAVIKIVNDRLVELGDVFGRSGEPGGAP